MIKNIFIKINHLKWIVLIGLLCVKSQWCFESPEVLNIKFWLNTGYHQLELFVAPFKWKQKEWRRFVQISSLVGTAYILDKPVKKWSQKNKDDEIITFLMENKNYLSFRYYYLYGFGYLTNDQKLAKTSLMAFESGMLTSTIVFNLKSIFDRPRPIEVDLGRQIINDRSFPSGHTAGAFSISHMFAKQYADTPVKYIAYVPAVLMGYSRIYGNVHWLSDVIAGAAVGIYVSEFVWKRRINNRENRLEVMPLLGEFKGVMVKFNIK